VKFAASDRPIARVGIDAETPFTIKGTGKAFKILSSNLYKDKILAVVRELSTNAYDAHVDAGRGYLPFRVHLPNSLEPYFAVEDDGVGLSHEAVLTIFSTYFESTKTDSNDVNGCLGLGSKSPFAYVDSFTIESRYAGEIRTYAAYLDEGSCPIVTQIGPVQPTDRPNGVRIMMAVDKPRDYGEFADRARSVYEHFPVKPEVTGYADFQVNTYPVALEGDGWVLRSRTGGCRAIMGTIAYPIDWRQIPGLEYRERTFYALPLDITFPLGALEFTAGREDLSYDPTLTIPALKTRLSEVKAAIAKEIQDKFAACPTEVTARRLYADRTISMVIRNLHVTPFWNGKVIDSSEIQLHLKKFPGIEIRRIHHQYGQRRTSVIRDATVSEYHLDVAQEARFIIDDLPRGALSRVRALPESDRNIYLFNNDEHLPVLQKILHGVAFENVSGLPKPPTKVRSKTLVREFLSGPTGSFATDDLVPIEIDFDADAGLYVLRKSGSVVPFEGVTDNDEFLKVYRAAVQAKIFDLARENLVIVPWTLKDKFEQHDNWDAFLPTVKARVLAALPNHPNVLDLATAAAFREFCENAYTAKDYVGRVMKELVPFLPADHDITVLVNAYQAARSLKNDEHLSTLNKMLNIDVPQRAPFDFKASYEAIRTRYRLMTMTVDACAWRIRDKSDFGAIAEYILALDAN
jgi:hypothetical protein